MITLQGRTCRTLALAMAFAAASAPLFAMGSKEPKAAKNPNSLVVAESATTVTCRDADGNELTVRKNNERVIVNYTSLVTLWYQIGRAHV